MRNNPFPGMFWVECLHPVDRTIWRRAYATEVSSQKIYEDMLEDHFLPADEKYVFSYNGVDPVMYEFTVFSSYNPLNQVYLCGDMGVLKLVKKVPVPENRPAPGSEIRVDFIHPTHGAVLNASVNCSLTAGELIEAMVAEDFITPPDSCRVYTLFVENGLRVEEKETLWDGYAVDGCKVRIICCGVAKPVIYLYPPEPMDIQVSLKNADNLTVSYPEYGDGWNVRAEPDGTLHDLKDGNEYSYLFWEAAGDRLYDLKSGFVVRRHELLPFLREKLASFGLTPKEYNEFIVYWYPILKQYEACAINFFCEEYEVDYALDITPNPDHLLRVYMLYRAADADEILQEPPAVSAVSREGFTVIEWGGQLLG